MKELSRIIRRKRREFSMHQNGKAGNGLPFHSNSYKFHHKENSSILKFVIKKSGKLQIIIRLATKNLRADMASARRFVCSQARFVCLLHQLFTNP